MSAIGFLRKSMGNPLFIKSKFLTYIDRYETTYTLWKGVYDWLIAAIGAVVILLLYRYFYGR